MKGKLLILSIFILLIFSIGSVCAVDDTSDLSDSNAVGNGDSFEGVNTPVEESQNEDVVDESYVEENNSSDVSYSSLDEKDEKIQLGSSYEESDVMLQDSYEDDVSGEITVLHLEAKNMVTHYKSHELFNIKLNPYSKDIDDLYTRIELKIYFEDYLDDYYKCNNYYMSGNSIGIDLSELSVGKYKLVISGLVYYTYDYVIEDSITVDLTILPKQKINMNVKAPKVTNKNLKITLTNKATKKRLSGVLLKLKVYTGKKYKTYKVKTNKKGVATFNTGKLSDGKHKIIITSGNKTYVMKKVKTYFTAKPHKLKVGKYSLRISNKNWQYIKTHKLKKGEWGPIKKFKTKYYRKYTWYSYPTKIITKTKRKLYIHTWYANGGIQQRVYDSALDTPSGWKYSGQKIVSKYHDSKHYIIYKKKVEVDKEVKHRSKARVYFNVWGRGPKVYVMAYCGHRGGIYKSKSVRLKI